MKILIIDEGDTCRCHSMHEAHMVIVKKDTRFDIIKNRWSYNLNNLPLELLPAVIKNPQGKLTWV